MVKGRRSGGRKSGASEAIGSEAASAPAPAPPPAPSKPAAPTVPTPDAVASTKQAEPDKAHKKRPKKEKRHSESHRPSEPAEAAKPDKGKESNKKKSSSKSPDALLPSVPLTPGKVSLVAPVWSHDGTLLLFPRPSGVRIMVRSTNRTAGVLAVPPGSGAIVAVALHPRNMARMIALTSTFTLLEFDYLDPQLLRVSKLTSAHGASVVSLVPALVASEDETEEKPYALVATSAGRILAVDMSVGGRRPYPVEQIAHLPDTIKAMDVASDNQVLVVGGTQGIYLAKTNAALAATNGQRPSRTWVKVPTKYPTTALAMPSVTSTLATGDENGVVRLWPGLVDPAGLERLLQQAKPMSNKSGVAQLNTYVGSTAMHWHPHPVRALAFARRDAVVLSGGDESTLVVWQIGVSGGGGGNETKKEFAPRLPAFITDISPVPPPPVLAAAPTTGGARRAPSQTNESAGMYAVTCSDGSTAVLSAATLRMDQIYAPEGARAIDPALAANQPTASLGIPMAVSGNLALLPGPRPASIQIVDPSIDQHLLTLETAPDNRVGAMNDVLPEPVRPRVAALSLPSPAALASSSSVWTKASLPPWLATVESRLAAIRSDGTLVEQEQALVFWHARASATSYTLASRIERPHQGTVTGAAFAPPPNGPTVDPHPRLATVANDGSVRLWSLASRPSARGAVRSWRLGAALSFRNAQPTSMAWDASGEVLAVGWSYDPKLPSTSGDMPWGAVTLIDASPQALASGSAGILRTFPLGTMGLQSVNHLAWTSSTSVVRTLIATSPAAIAVLDVVDGVCLARGAVDSSNRRRIHNLLPPKQPSTSLVGWVVLGPEKKDKGTSELVSLSLRSSKSEAGCATVRMTRVGLLPTLRTVMSLPVPAHAADTDRAHTVLLGLSSGLDVLAFGTAPLPPASRVLRRSEGQPSLWAQLVGPPPETAPSAMAAAPFPPTRAGAAQTEAHAGLALLRPFDAPAHLLPSVGSLLLSVQKALLPPAPATAAHPAEREATESEKDEDGDTAFTDAAAPSSEAQGSSSSFATAAPSLSLSALSAQGGRAQSVQIALGTPGLEAITSALENVVLGQRKEVVVPDADADADAPAGKSTSAPRTGAEEGGDGDALSLPAAAAADLSITSTGRPSKSNARKRKARVSQ